MVFKDIRMASEIELQKKNCKKNIQSIVSVIKQKDIKAYKLLISK
jgi:hypothetical protein